MDEKENAQKPAESTSAPTPPPIPPPIDPPPVAQGAAPEGDKPHEKISTSDKIMAAATIVIALGTIVSAVAIVLQWREMVSGGADTIALVGYAQRQADDADKIKASADKQATTAQQFADTAVLINGGIGGAVKKLDAQAKAIEASRKSSELASAKALKATIDNFYFDQRPWVGIEIVPATLPPNAIQTGPGVTASTVIIVAHNTGRTPALRWHSECCETLAKDIDEPVPDYDTLKADLIRHMSPGLQAYMAAHPAEAPRILQGVQERQAIESRYFSKTVQVIPPNGTHGLDVTSVNSNDHKFHYTVGKMVYWDLLGPSKEHVTKFCLVSWGGSPLRLCDGGQDMN